MAKEAGLTREWNDQVINRGKVKHKWRPLWQVIRNRTAHYTAATLLKQVSKNNKALAKLVLGHAEEDVANPYAKDTAHLLAPAVLEAWRGRAPTLRNSAAASYTHMVCPRPSSPCCRSQAPNTDSDNTKVGRQADRGC